MEFSSFLDLDDDLFTEARDRSKHKDNTDYQAKICDAQWFERETAADEGEEMQLHKYTADYAFRCREYQKALQHYKNTLVLLSPTNMTMTRDVQEAICRCHLALDNAHDAALPARQLGDTAQNFDQKTTSLSLLSEVYKATGDLDFERLTLLKSIWLHPLNCDTWLRLSYVYLSLFKDIQKLCKHSEGSDEKKGADIEDEVCESTRNLSIEDHRPGTSNCEDMEDRQDLSIYNGLQDQSRYIIIGTCLLRTKILAQHVGHLPLFVKTRYRNIIADMDRKLKDLEFEDSFLNARKVMLEADVFSDKPADYPANIPETKLIKKVEEDDFQKLFHQRWFPEHL